MTKYLFRDKTWLISWANDRHTELRVERFKTGFIDYALRYQHNGAIAYNYPETIPAYIKKKVRMFFARAIKEGTYHPASVRY